MRKIILFNTADFYDDEFGDEYELDKENTLNVLDNFIKNYEQRYNTEIGGYLLLGERSSGYGAITGNGLRGYRFEENLEDLFKTSADDLKVYIDENRKINFVYNDHDGSTYSELKLLPMSLIEKADRLWNEESEDYYQSLAQDENVTGTNYFKLKKVGV